MKMPQLIQQREVDTGVLQVRSDIGLTYICYAKSNRSAFITFVHAATKSCMNFSLLSS